jgi:hypothetical protein
MSSARLLRLGVGLMFLGILSLALVSYQSRLNSSAVQGASKDAATPRVEAYGNLPLAFEANQGQMDARFDFLSRGHGYSLQVGPTEIGLSLTLQDESTPARNTRFYAEPSQRRGAARMMDVRMKIAGANPHPAKTGRQELPGKVNYFIGQDPQQWRTNVSTYARVEYQNVYPGVDLVYYGNQRQLEYDFVVAPGSDPRTIALDFEGAEELAIDGQGDLVMQAGGETALRLHKPSIYQEIDGARREIAGGYLLNEHHVGFEIGSYDSSRPLVIDPVFVYSTHLGGGGGEAGWAIAADHAGNVYVTGDTNATAFPLSKKPLQKVYGGATDIFVTKLSPDGSKILYSTYLGGSDADVGYGIALDSQGNIYITGDTSSTDFPLVNPLQKKLAGAPDIFVAKLSADGARLLYSTYIGGSKGERGNGIAVDSQGNAIVAGYTNSTDFPTASPHQKEFAGGNSDCIVFKLNPSGSAFVYSTYLGGGNDRPDIASAVAVDAAGNAYVTGFTNSRDFPSVNAIQPFAGPTDVFVTKFSGEGKIVYSTHIGGNADDEAMSIAVDSAGSAYVTGETESLDFPTTPGAISRSCVAVSTRGPMQKICSGGDAFVSKISPDGSKLVYSTYINGTRFEVGRGIAVDATGNAYITGFTGSLNYPTEEPLQKTYGGGKFDAFVTKLNADGTKLLYSTYLGGSGNDGGYGIALDGSGNAYVTGYTESSDFPTYKPLKGASKAAEGVRDVFVTKISDKGGAK